MTLNTNTALMEEAPSANAVPKVQTRAKGVGKNILITFWVVVPSKTEPKKFFDFLQQQGYLRIWIDNQVVRVDDPNPKLKRLGARVQVVQDRIAIGEENRTRLGDALRHEALSVVRGRDSLIPGGTAQVGHRPLVGNGMFFGFRRIHEFLKPDVSPWPPP